MALYSIILAITIALFIITVATITTLKWFTKSQWRNHSIAINSSIIDAEPSVINKSEFVTVEKSTGCRATARPLVHKIIKLKRLNTDLNGSEYQKVEKCFREQWIKLTTDYLVPPIPVAIYAIQNDDLGCRYHQYKEKTFGNSSQEPNEEWHFHGTSIECDIISSDKCCSTKTCGICGISRDGFDLSSVRNRFQRFGKGIYFAPNSSKSNDYATSNQYGYKAQLLCRVACGNKHVLYNDDTSLLAPPANCHSVYGKASTDGKLNYDEVVVYDADAVIPQFILIYENPVESSVIHDQEVAVAYQPRNKPFRSCTMAGERNTQSYDYAWHSHSQQHMSLNYDQRNTSPYKLSSVAPTVKQISRSQYMYNQSWNAPYTSYATVFSEHKTDSDNYKCMRENPYHNDQSRSSPFARGVAAYGCGTSSSDHKMVNVKQKSNSQYMHDHSRSSPSVGGISRYAIPLAEYKVKQKNKSQTDQSRNSPSSGGKYGSTTSQPEHEMKKQKNKDSRDQSWSSYIIEGISSMLSWSDPTEGKQKGQYDHSWSLPSVVVDGKQKRESRYDHTRSLPVRRSYGHATPSSEHHTVGGGKQKTKSQFVRSSPSVGGISRNATPWVEHKIGGSKQKNKSQTDQSRSSPSSGGKYGSTTSQPEREMKKQKNEDSHDHSWSSYIVEEISRLSRYNSLSWLEPTESKQKGQYDHSWSLPSVASSSEHLKLAGGKQKSKSQFQSRSSPAIGGTSRYATPLSEDRTGGDHGRKHKSKRHYDSLPYAEGISSFATPLSEYYKGNAGKQKQYLSTGQISHYSTSYSDRRVGDSKQKTKGHCNQSGISPSAEKFSSYATPLSEHQVGRAKHQSKSLNDHSGRLPSSGVKSGHGATGQSTNKGARKQSGRAMYIKSKRQ